MTEEQFDQLLQEMRDENPPSEDAAAARERVWQRLSGAASACASFQPDIGEYVAGRLSESRRMLLEDHFGRCVECRHLLSDAKGMHKVAVMPPVRRAQQPAWTRWALAAGVALGALYLGRGTLDRTLAPSGPRATVESISGNLVQVSQDSLKSGDVLLEGEAVRTGADSRAILRLADGSRVEMNQRTELAVLAAWSGETIRLNRGDVVVQAAKQRRGHLRVVTRDSVTSVKGTVFAVSSGAAGSLVSVVEGSVAVSGAGTQRVITAGQQAASNPALDRVRVREAISWSQDAEKYFTLIAEFSDIQKQLAAMPAPALRTQASLLPFMPASAGVYIAIPNLDGTIRQALNQVEMRARDNSVLNDWWSSDSGQRLKQTLDRVQAITPLLGEEVVFTISKDLAGGLIPLMLAAIQPGRQDALRQAVERLVEDHPEKIPYQINQNLLLISDNAAHLATIAAQLGTGASSPFATEIASRYQSGVSWLAGIDVNTVGSAVQQSDQGRILGMPNMRFLFFQQNWGARDDNEATLSFQGSRTGIASWLAPAGSSGSAEYISPEAVAALSASSRSPRQAVDELLSILGQGSDLTANLKQFESETGVSITNDLAASFGTDFTLAIERPSLPMPGWVAVAEVLSPSALDDSVRRLADAYNRKLTAEQTSRQATLSQETVNGRAWNSIQTAGGSLTLYWTYDHGYMIASTDRAIATRAIAIHDSGSSLITSASFQQRFPATSDLHHSGFLWFNSNGVLADLASLVQSPAIKSLLGSREPLLILLDGETERIHAASRTSLTQLILDLMLVRGAHQAG